MEDTSAAGGATAVPLLTRRRDAIEELALGGGVVRIALLLDGADTGGAMSAIRVALRAGATGTGAHCHDLTTETFVVLAGTVLVLADGQTLIGKAGDVFVLAPGTEHAFAATSEADTEVLILATPGLDRFDYFRALAAGVSPRDAAAEAQFDTRVTPEAPGLRPTDLFPHHSTTNEGDEPCA